MNNGTEQICLVPSGSKPSSTMQVDLENVKDMSTVCRTCAAVTELVVPIFEGEGLQNNLADKIHKHLPIKVSREDALPRVVCYQCASTLLAWHDLVQACARADSALRARLPHVATVEEKHKTIRNLSNASVSYYDHVRTVIVNYLHSMNINENLDMEYACQLCIDGPPVTGLKNLSEHLLTVHNSETADYESIDKFIKDNITFVEALDSEDSDRYIECDYVDVKLASFSCPFCDSTFSSPTRLMCHLNRHVEVCIGNAIVCCDVSYNSKKDFVTHLQERHILDRPDNTDNTHKCRSCAHRAESAEALQQHIDEHHGSHEQNTNVKKQPSSKNQKCIPAVCPECNTTFSNKYNMFSHMKGHSRKTVKFQCDRCSKCYSNQGNLNNHKKQVHEGILKFVCWRCGEAFPTRLARDVHARLHTGDKPYACTVCNKSFRAKNTLDRHIDMHLDVRNYECQHCKKKFRKRSHLNYHLGTHKET